MAAVLVKATLHRKACLQDANQIVMKNPFSASLLWQHNPTEKNCSTDERKIICFKFLKYSCMEDWQIKDLDIYW